jgi:hypothetical protein
MAVLMNPPAAQPIMRLAVMCLAMWALYGCALGTVVDVATAPVRAAGKAVDLATTSQSEADEKRGRDLRQLEERYGKLVRAHQRAEAQCRNDREEDCPRAAALAEEMADLRARLPSSPAARRD